MGIALGVLRVLADTVPPFAAWLRVVTDGRTDTFSLSVKDILPEVSESHAVVVELEGR
ncbi:hypothetical protein [Pendulispora albinea]|uniref:Uncharacterized protein n=1 Tax=Pendulispora albinea TaxID=2741071 RepID=A0ABZ2M0P8_9BACT